MKTSVKTRRLFVMKKMVERTFCDMPLCRVIAHAVCSSCERDICEGHRGWVDTGWLTPLPPNSPRVTHSRGFNLCRECMGAFEAVFVKNRHKGDGFGPMPVREKTANL